MLVIFGIITAIAIPEQVNAQTDTAHTNNQITLSKNIEDDPLAQDILKKIEETKKWVADLEYRENQKEELAEKRALALASLEQDLEAWQKLWEKFTFDYAFERKTGIFWDQYNFTKSKIMAGRAALEKVLIDGGNAEEARSAYVNAATIKRSEIIEANNLFNVKRGFAYYNQQILFDSDGQFRNIVSGDQFRKYYQDFRVSPAYLNSNPNDESSWTELSVSIQSECRNGHVLIHRFQTEDYVCVTEQTSEMWHKHNMGKPMIDYIIHPEDEQLTIEKFRDDRIKEKIRNINNKINTIYIYYDERIADLEKKYKAKVDDLEKLKREAEKIIITEFEDTYMDKKEFMERIEKVRDTYDSHTQLLLTEKEQVWKIMEINHEQYVEEFIQNFEEISNVGIVWDSDRVRYKAVRK